ncbi:Heterokaryon incompatibility protein (HET) domain containing protein [Naviculisporaceae sp. PSN 640]
MASSLYSSRLPRDHIRLISFVKNDDDDTPSGADSNHDKPLLCTLTDISLEEAKKNSFDALSYCWGDPNLRKPIVVNGQHWTVTEQLDQALRRLSKECPERRIWADALCINQEDNDEKSTQIPFMGTIYREAEHVFIWLGPSNKILDEFVLFLKNKETRIDPETLNRLIVYNVALFSLPWWSRTWTFQEFVLASRPVFLFGPHLFQFTQIETLFGWLRARYGDRIEETRSLMSRSYKEAREIFGDNLDAMIRQWPKGWLFVSAASDLVQNRQRLSLVRLLTVTAGRQLSDPRDRIYALYNLLSPEERVKIHVDYNEPKWGLYHRTICSMFSDWKTKYLELLTRFDPRTESDRSDPQTPSWVLDFASDYLQEHCSTMDMKAHRPWLHEQSSLELSTDGLVLKVSGTRLSHIRVVEEIGDEFSENEFSDEYFSRIKKIMGVLVAARSQRCDSTSRLASIDSLRKRELPLQLLYHTLVPEAALSGAYSVEYEIIRRSATELAQLRQKDLDSVPVGLEWTLKVVVDAVIPLRRSGWYFVTRDGFYGFSKVRTAENDLIMLPRGSTMFLVLRPVTTVEGTAGKQQYRLVGPAYVAGLMDFKELADMMDEEAKREEPFKVV